jgi:hypothetical protein
MVKALVKKVTQSYKLLCYFLTPTFSVCQDQGHLTGEQASGRKLIHN